MSNPTGNTSRHHRGRGIGTVIGCVIAAIAIGLIWDDDPPYRPTVSIAWADDANTGRSDVPLTSFSINAGHIVVKPTDGQARVELDEDLREHAKITSTGSHMSIEIDDRSGHDGEVQLYIPRATACDVTLMAGLLRSEGLPCDNTTFTLRAGKMVIKDVPAAHGALRGEVGVGTVRMTEGEGATKKSTGVGELRAELPGTLNGPTLTARVDVGMLLVDVD